MSRALLAAALWLGVCVFPSIALGQDAAAEAAAVSLAVRPWLRFVEWTGLVRPDAWWAGRLSAEPLAVERPTPEAITWKSAFEEREAQTHDSRALMSWRALTSSSLWSGTLTGDVRLLAVEAPNSIGLWAEPRRWLRVALKENWGPVAVGLRFESASPELERVTGGKVKDETEGGEGWVEGRAGLVRLRLSGGQFWDNLADYPWQPRTTKTQGGAALGVPLPLGAALGVAYQGGLAEQKPGPRPRTVVATEPRASAFHSVVTSLSCSGSDWSVAVSSTYSPSTDLRHRDRETVSLAHDVSATFRLGPSLTITPALSFAEDTYEWSGGGSQTTEASLAVSWTSVLEGVDLTVSGSYARNHTSDELSNAAAISAAAGLVWRLPQVGPARTSLALEAGSNHYLDRVTASAGYAEVYGMLTLRITTF